MSTENEGLLQALQLSNIRANYAGALFHPSVELLTSIGTVIVLVAGGFFVTKGRMDVAEIVGFFAYLSLFYTLCGARDLTRMCRTRLLPESGCWTCLKRNRT